MALITMNNVEQLCLDLTIETENQYQGVCPKHSSGRINKPACKAALLNILLLLRADTAHCYSMPAIPVSYDDIYALALHVLADMRAIRLAPTIHDINKANDNKSVGEKMTVAHFDVVANMLTANLDSESASVETVTIIINGMKRIECKRDTGTKQVFYGKASRMILNQTTTLANSGMMDGTFISMNTGLLIEFKRH